MRSTFFGHAHGSLGSTPSPSAHRRRTPAVGVHALHRVGALLDGAITRWQVGDLVVKVHQRGARAMFKIADREQAVRVATMPGTHGGSWSSFHCPACDRRCCTCAPGCLPAGPATGSLASAPASRARSPLVAGSRRCRSRSGRAGRGDCRSWSIEAVADRRRSGYLFRFLEFTQWLV